MSSISTPSHRSARVLLAAAATIALALLGLLVPSLSPTAHADSTSSLPVCPFWTDATPPARTVSPWVPPSQTASAVDFSSRLPVPAGITGSLSGSQVTVTFDTVPGATSYRLWRNGQSVAWLLGNGQSSISITDTSPCQNAFYTVAAFSDQSASDASTGQLSAPYQLSANGSVLPWATPVGRTIPMMVTSYNDVGQTDSGYNSQLGVCATDPRVIPLGTYFQVPGYGICYAGDIGTWIQNDTVDVWLPGAQADNWGVQDRTVTIIANPYTGGQTASPTPSPTPSPTARPTATASPTPSASPTPPVTGGNSYQATAAALGGSAALSSCAACTGGEKVSSIGGSGHGTATFTGVSEPAAGTLPLTVHYLSVGKARSAVVTVDGVARTVQFPETSASSYSVVGTVTVSVKLSAGSSNTVEFSGSGTAGAPDLALITA